MSDKTENKLDILMRKYIIPYAADVQMIRDEDGIDDHLLTSNLVSAVALLIVEISENGGEMLSFLVNTIGNIIDVTFRSAAKYYDSALLLKMKEELKNNISSAIVPMVSSLDPEGIEKFMEQMKEHAKDCDCPTHKAMREVSVH